MPLSFNSLIRSDGAAANYLVLSFIGIFVGVGLFFLLLLPIKYVIIGIFVFLVPLLAFISGQWKTVFLATLILGIPLQLKKTLYGYTLGHICGPGGIDFMMADGALILLYIHWMYEIVTNKHRTFMKFEKIDVLILVFILLNGVALLKNIDMTLGIIDFIRIVKVALIYFYLANNIKKVSELKFIVFILLAGTFVHIVISILQYKLGHSIGLAFLGEITQFRIGDLDGSQFSRPSGIMQGANTSASFLVSVLPLAFVAMFWAKNSFMKLFDLGIFFSGIFVLIITYSRGGWVGFGFLLPIMFYFLIKRGYLSYRKHYVSALLLGLSVLSVVIYLSPKIMDRLVNSSPIPVQTRIFLNQTALSMISSNPVSGVGLNNFSEAAQNVIRDIPDPNHIFRYVSETPVVHNLYLLIAAETGIVSLLVFLAILLQLMMMCWRSIRSREIVISSLGIGMFSFLSGFLVIEMFDFSFRLDNVFYLFWALAGIAVASYRMFERNRETDNIESSPA